MKDFKKDFKKDFEKWLLDFEPNENVIKVDDGVTYPSWIFHELPKSMQWGVYVDFLDSVGYDVQAYCYHGKYSIHIYDKDDTMIFDQDVFETRQEAREKALKKAIEIYGNT